MNKLNKNIQRIDVLRIEHNAQKMCRCRTPQYELDTENRLVYCSICGAIIDPFDALASLAKSYERINKQVERALKQAESLSTYKPHLQRIKEIEQHYKNNLYPLCPNCSASIDLEDIKSYSQFKTTQATKHEGQWIQVDENKRKCSCCETTFIIYAYPDCITSVCPHCGAHLKVPKHEIT